MLMRAKPRVLSTVIPAGHVLAVMANSFGWYRVCEVGVRRGFTAAALLEHAPLIAYTGVDSWAETPPDGESDPNYRYYSAEESARHYRTAQKKLAKFACRADLIVGESLKVAARLSDESFDCVYIDADHRYAAVKADIAAWAPKVKPGGWLMGHDLVRPDIERAVSEDLPGWVKVAPCIWGWRK